MHHDIKPTRTASYRGCDFYQELNSKGLGVANDYSAAGRGRYQVLSMFIKKIREEMLIPFVFRAGAVDSLSYRHRI